MLSRSLLFLGLAASGSSQDAQCKAGEQCSGEPAPFAYGAGNAYGPNDIPLERPSNPHHLFPYDIFGEAAVPFLSEEMATEIGHVRNYCMFPPYPWSLVAYDHLVTHDILMAQPAVQGAFAEFGVGEGGTSIYFARKAKMHGRKFLSVDSFAGLPPPNAQDNQYFVEGDYGPPKGVDNHKAFLDLVERMDVNDTVTVVKGFFGDIEIPKDPAFEQFAFVHLDSDLYQSIYDSFMKIWDRVVPGGFVIVDDYFHFVQGPARAVADFFRDHVGEPPVLFVLPVHAVLIVKGMTPCPNTVQAATAESSRPDWGDHLATRPVFSRALDGNFYSFQAIRSIPSLHKTVEASVARVTQEYEMRKQNNEPVHELERIRRNAESFLGFMRYPDDLAMASSVDLYRYLVAFEDVIDLQEAYDCRTGGRTKKNEIRINKDSFGDQSETSSEPLPEE